MNHKLSLRSIVLTGIGWFFGILVIAAVMCQFVTGDAERSIAGLATGTWLTYGYRRVFKGFPVVRSISQSVRAFALALCWPVADR